MYKMSHEGNMFSVLHTQKHDCGAHASLKCHLIHPQNVSDNTDHHTWINNWRFQGPENFIFQKIHSHNMLKYGHIYIIKGSAYILVYILSFRGSTEVKMLCYKSEGSWFDPS